MLVGSLLGTSQERDGVSWLFWVPKEFGSSPPNYVHVIKLIKIVFNYPFHLFLNAHFSPSQRVYMGKDGVCFAHLVNNYVSPLDTKLWSHCWRLSGDHGGVTPSRRYSSAPNAAAPAPSPEPGAQ